MARPRLVAIALAALAAASLATTVTQSATPLADPFGPGPEECRIDPRPLDELRALVGNTEAEGATPAAGAATPDGVVSFPPVELPAGTPADAATAAAVTSTVRQRYACLNAGDLGRYLAVFSDDVLRRPGTLNRLAAGLVADGGAAEPEPRDVSQRVHFAGLFHVRVLPDGRVVAIAPPGFLGVPERFDFIRVGDRWLIDEITPVMDASVPVGVVGTTFTGEHRRTHTDLQQAVVQSGGFGYGLAWEPSWEPLTEPASAGVHAADLALTNGTSLVVFGSPLGDPEAGLAACVAPDFADPAADVWQFELDPAFFDQERGIVPATTADGQPLRDDDGQRAFAVYDVGYRTGGRATDAAPYRLYLECRAMAGGAWVLGLAQLVPAAAYDAEVGARAGPAGHARGLSRGPRPRR